MDPAALDDPATRQDALWEIGFARAMGGDPAGALELMSAKARESGLSPGQRIVLAAQHARVGRLDEARAMLAAVAAEHPSERAECEAEADGYALMRDIPRERAMALMAELRARFTYADWPEVEARIAERLAGAEPFLMLRLGDGEGTQMRLGREDEARYPALYRANRRSYIDFWFGRPEIVDEPAWDRVIDRFNAAIARADVLGGFSEVSVDFAYGMASRRDVTWVANTLRGALQAAEADPAWARRTLVTPLDIHYRLLEGGAFERLLRNRPRIGLMGCHDALPDRLRTHFDVGHVEFHHTPGERAHATLFDRDRGRHWPDRFRRLDAALARGDRRGELWLVAAGFLGKLYAERLHATGAVVVDLGAVADVWMGVHTRSGHGHYAAHALPPAPALARRGWRERLAGLVGR